MYVCILIYQSMYLGCGFSGTDLVFKRRGKSIYCSCIQQGCFRWKIKSTSCHFNRLHHSPIPRPSVGTCPSLCGTTLRVWMVSHAPTQCSVSWAVRTASHVTRGTSHVTRGTCHVTRGTSHVTRSTSHVTRGTTHVTRGTCHVTRGTTHVTVTLVSHRVQLYSVETITMSVELIGMFSTRLK